MTAKSINVVLGIWLFISAFVWPHSASQFTNTWIVGVLIVAFALISMGVSQFRYANAVLAVWLFVSVWALPRMGMATAWNNALIALAVFALSLLGERTPVRRPIRTTV